MRIAVIQATIQISKNKTLFKATVNATTDADEVTNFGVFEGDPTLSYVQVSIIVGLLLNSHAVDYVVTGCSSGNGMDIACNAMPNVICGYLPTPADAYLFGRINHGNCASIPLGLNFGWAGEVNLRFTLEKLFGSPMNVGYPQASAARKEKDALLLKDIKQLSQTDMRAILEGLSEDILQPIFAKRDVMDYIFAQGDNLVLKNYLNSRI